LSNIENLQRADHQEQEERDQEPEDQSSCSNVWLFLIMQTQILAKQNGYDL